MPHFPIVLMPMPIRQQLDAIAPLSSGRAASSPRGAASKADEKTERSFLFVHVLAMVFGGVLVLIGLFSGKMGVLALGFVMGGGVLAMGLAPYFIKKVPELQQTEAPADEYDFQMTDKEWKWEGIRIWLLKHYTPPEIFLPNPIRGKPEQQFALSLHQYFPHNIMTDKVIELFKKNHAYHPDFTFVEADSHLYIDIEIDEPYSSRGHHPTHYCQQDGTASDAVRNDYFLKKGWVVLRFAESQIVLYPEECCKFIARLVFHLTGNDTYWTQWSYSHPKLPLVPQWTKEEAEKMAIENYRNQYK